MENYPCHKICPFLFESKTIRPVTLHQQASAATTGADIANLLELESRHLAKSHKDLCVLVGAAIRVQNVLKA